MAGAGAGTGRAVPPDTNAMSKDVSDRGSSAGAAGESGRVGRWIARLFRATAGFSGLSSDAPASSGWPWAAKWRVTSFGIFLGLAVTVVWAVTGAHYFWPGWIWFALALPLAFQGAIRRALRTNGRRALAMHAAVSLVVALAGIVIWLLSGHGYFWPIWPFLGLAIALAGHAWLVPMLPNNREQALRERVAVLTRTRRGALDVQAAEMQRLERDLHDGAQARLVSLGMSLGMADELLDIDPAEARRLLVDARIAAGDALADLRALVRGIHPPVLADRGLNGAIQALVLAVPIPVEATIDLPEARLALPVESAAYFAVAEALTNVVKHSEASTAWIQVHLADGKLSIVVGDDGIGGADPEQGTGLRGIERRLAAFDGTLRVSSPPGGPTLVTMEVPCEPSSQKTSPS
jgi:signal transduction histidine kinase